MALNDKVISHWKLDEDTTANRVDSVGSFDLSPNDGGTNSIDNAAGKIGSAVDFQGDGDTNEFLEGPDSTTFRFADTAFAIAGWVNFDDLSVNRRIIAKWNTTQGREWLLYYNQPLDRFAFAVRNAGDSANTQVTADTFGSPSTGTWYFVYVEHDPVANTIGISINNGTLDTAAHSGGLNTTTQLTAATLGSLGTSAGTLEDPGSTNDGKQDAWSIFDDTLTAQEITDLYNGGTGQEHPFTEGGGGAGGMMGGGESKIWAPPFVVIG